MTSIYWSALILGIVSNLHCFAMCGPIAMSVPINRKSEFTILTSSFFYHTGRITTYILLGFLVGMIGFGIHLVGILQSLSIVSGIGIIFYAWRYQLLGENADKIFKTALPYNLNSRLMGKVAKSNSSFKPLLLGMLNGMLPCGMVYTALITSLLSGNLISGSLSMLFFGLGTYPTMIILMYVTQKTATRFKSKINRFLPVILSIVGLLILLRGMNLNIPYLSPQATFSQEKNQIQIKDCHTFKNDLK
jgi:sulfite exporter TauE/SafE